MSGEKKCWRFVKRMNVGGLLVLSCLLGVGALASRPAIAANVETDQGVDDAAFKAQIDKLFKEAMEKRKSGDTFAAIEIFQSILSGHPKLHRARLEMAVAFYQSYKFNEALKQAKVVLDDPMTPPKVRTSILAFMAQVKQDSKMTGVTGHTWRFPVEFGYVYDTNANVGPDSSIVDGVVLGQDAAKKSKSGVVMSLGVDHTYQSVKKMNWGSQPVSFLWQSGGHVYHRGYWGEDNYNMTTLSLRTGPTFMVSRRWRANISIQDDIINYAGRSYGNFIYLLPSISYHWGLGGLESTVDAVLSRRDYTQDQYQGRDSDYFAPRVYIGDVFLRGKLALQAGLQYFNENADDNEYGNEGTYLFANVNWQFMPRTNISLGYGIRYERHDEPSTGFESLGARDETERQYKIGANYTFKGLGMLDKWRVNADVLINDRDSNLALYDYQRTMSTLTLSRTF